MLKSFESEPRPESTAGSLLLSTWDGLVGELLHIHAMMMMMNVDDDDNDWRRRRNSRNIKEI